MKIITTPLLRRFGPTLLLLLLPAVLHAAEIKVVDGLVYAVSGDKKCSLVEAILEANNNSITTDCTNGTNANPAMGEVGSDTILLGPSPYVIKDGYQGNDNGLPPITSMVTIVGQMQNADQPPSKWILTSITRQAPLNVRFFHITATGTVQLHKLELSNGAHQNGGAIYNDGTLEVYQSYLHDNKALATGPDSGGGAIYNTGTLIIGKQTIIDHNSAANGGGVFSTGTKYQFTQNYIGAVYVIGGSQLTMNTATEDGGGLYGTQKAKLSVQSDSVIQGNKATKDGGGIACEVSCSLTVSQAQILDNTAKSGAGVDGSSATLTFDVGSVLQGNVASASGGGISLYSGSATLTSTTLDKNQAANGGAISNSAGTVTLQACLVTGNKATTVGGALYNQSNGTLVTQQGGMFSNNSAECQNNPSSLGGGAIYNEGRLTIRKAIIQENYTQNCSGGGIYTRGERLVLIEDSTLTGNIAKQTATPLKMGGGIYSKSRDMVILRSALVNNQAPAASALHLDGYVPNTNYTTVTVTMANTTIAKNIASTATGGALWTNPSSANTEMELLNSTIVGNSVTATATKITAGIQASMGKVVLRNSILAANGYSGATYKSGNCQGSIIFSGHNLIDKADCVLSGASPSDQVYSGTAASGLPYNLLESPLHEESAPSGQYFSVLAVKNVTIGTKTFAVANQGDDTLCKTETHCLEELATPQADGTKQWSCPTQVAFLGTDQLDNPRLEGCDIGAIELQTSLTPADPCAGVVCKEYMCLSASCKDGTCWYASVAAGTACDDANPATNNDQCQSGKCIGTKPDLCAGLSCDDGNPCTSDSCFEGKCYPKSLPNGTQCDDSNAQTTKDQCAAGKCAGVAAAGGGDGSDAAGDADGGGTTAGEATTGGETTTGGTTDGGGTGDDSAPPIVTETVTEGTTGGTVDGGNAVNTTPTVTPPTTTAPASSGCSLILSRVQFVSS